jgi:fatty acid synthase, animal type
MEINSGIIKPLKSTIFPASEIEQAFRYMTTGKHIGKILLQIRGDQQSMPLTVRTTVWFDPELCYIVLGGLGGVGLELADWMVMRGCKKLVLSSSRGISSSYQSYRIR